MIKQLGYGYLYHYNSYNGTYLCFQREALSQVFNGHPSDRFENNSERFIAVSEVSFDDAAKVMMQHLAEKVG